jgi:hypothetical protein
MTDVSEVLNHVDLVDGVTLCLGTAATNGPIIHPQMINEHGEPSWNDIGRG